MKRLLLTLLFLSFASVAFAEDLPNVNVSTQQTNQSKNTTNVSTHNDGTNKPLGKIDNPLKSEYSNITDLINGLVDITLKLGTIIAVLALVWIGLKFILAQGDPKKIQEAKQMLQWVIIGIALLFSAKIIVEIIKGTLSQFTNLK